MRRLTLVLALIGASVLFFGAMPGTASAGNCTYIGLNAAGPGNTYIWYSGGQWLWNPIAYNCSGVSAVDFTTYAQGAPGAPPFLYDATHGAYHFPTAGGGQCTGNPTLSTCNTVYRNNVWGAGCGQPGFYVQPWYAYRLRSYPGQTWGPWHNGGGTSFLIC